MARAILAIAPAGAGLAFALAVMQMIDSILKGI